VPSNDHQEPPIVITGGLGWCIAAGTFVFERLQLPADIVSADGLNAVAARLRADPTATVVYVCGASSPRHYHGLERLRGEHPHAHLVAASPEPDPEIAQHARALGLLGYTHFDASPSDTGDVIRRVRDGERAFMPTDRTPAVDTAPLDDPELERRIQQPRYRRGARPARGHHPNLRAPGDPPARHAQPRGRRLVREQNEKTCVSGGNCGFLIAGADPLQDL
jgi:hypothetical protein